MADEVLDETPQGDAQAIEEAKEIKDPPTDEDSKEEKPDTEKVEEPPKKSDSDKANLSYKLREQNRRLKEQDKKIDQLIGLVEKQSTAQNKAAIVRPKADDFDTLDEYIDAKYDYREKLAEANREDAQTQKQPSQKASEPPEGIEEFFESGSEAHDDFVDVINSIPPRSLTNEMATALIEIDDDRIRTETAYYLGNNHKEAARIARLSPTRQVAEIGKLEAKMDKPKKSATASAAPAPIKPVGGSKTFSTEITGKESYEDFVKKRDKQLGR